MDYIGIFITFFGGLGLFLYGMHIMASGLQKAAGSKMKRILEILTKNKLMGIILGAVVTAIIQSSSATTVMVVGFVNAGLMNLTQSIGVIMGANIGTTVTSWLVSSVEWAKFLKPEVLAPVAVGVGVILSQFCKREKVKRIGDIVVGFGVLFIGISMMSDGVKPLRDLPAFADAFATLGKSPVLGILAGAFVTAIIQSSSASVGILQSLAMTGLVSWNSAVYIIMGQNIGTCVTALLSSIGANKNAKGAAYMHLSFNVIGSVIFSILAACYFTFFNPQLGFAPISLTQISVVHTSFNIANTIMLYPFSGLIVKIAEKLSSLGTVPTEDEGPVHLDDRILETPGFAIVNCMKEITRLGYMALDNLKLSLEALTQKDIDKIQRVFQKEKSIDSLDTAITQYMVKICNSDISDEENSRITALFHTVNDFERIGDHSENIAEIAQYMVDDSRDFSSLAYKEMNNIIQKTISSVEFAVQSFENSNLSLAKETYRLEREIDDIEQDLRAKHITRLANQTCDPVTGVMYLDTITNLERISDYALNVAQAVVKIKKNNSKNSN